MASILAKVWHSPRAGLQPNKIADSVIRVSSPVETIEAGDHPARFPVALCDHIYRSFANPNERIYEPFCGSGTAIIACERFGASCYGMELAPDYVDVAVRRWQDFTGQKAVHAKTGQTYAERAALV